VAFGGRGLFHYATITNGTACSNTVFGDPAPGFHKACYVEAAPPASNIWLPCADETGTCSFTGSATVAFGAAGQFHYATVTGGTPCSNAVFGDPLPSTHKACYLVAAPPTVTTWTACAAENRTCSFVGTREVAYGANGQYGYRSVTDGTPCSNAVFGDPAPGMAKTCFVQ
jgi:hypothetical protein